MRKASKSYNLQIENPSVSKEWHPIKNGTSLPQDFTPFSGKKAWWLCAKNHEWETKIIDRAYGRGCPYCSGHRVCDDNSLQTVNPQLAREWHPNKNNILTPSDVVSQSHKKVWWLCSKRHEWQATVANRKNGRGCPYCSGNKVCEDNSLQTINPQLASEWHPSKNGLAKPNNVLPNAIKNYWWLCKNNHEYKASINNRNQGKDCPYCAGQKVCADNCLQAVNPKLAKDWHPTKNGTLTPKDVTCGTDKRVWWLCSRGHEWKVSVGNRDRGTGCPYCNSQTSQLELRVFKEMAFLFGDVKLRHKIKKIECDVFIQKLGVGIEIDGLYWHQNKYKKDIIKTLSLEKAGVKLLRLREKGLERVNENDIYFDAPVKNEINIIKKILTQIISLKDIGFEARNRVNKYIHESKLKNDKEYRLLLDRLPSPILEFSLKYLNPKLSNEWHPTNNGNLRPSDVYAKSSKKAWWVCSQGHSWEAVINSRSCGRGCPYCNGQKVGADNCLQSINPKLAKEWHPTLNGELTPFKVTAGSGKKAWWICSQNHEWYAVIGSRVKGAGCPYCSGRKKSRTQA